MFFSKKSTIKEDPSEPQLKPKSPKEEPEDSKNCCDEAKTNVSTSVGPDTSHLKREYADFSSDIKPSVNEDEKHYTSPAKKKGNVKGSGDKQKTLFSYFGKG